MAVLQAGGKKRLNRRRPKQPRQPPLPQWARLAPPQAVAAGARSAPASAAAEGTSVALRPGRARRLPRPCSSRFRRYASLMSPVTYLPAGPARRCSVRAGPEATQWVDGTAGRQARQAVQPRPDPCSPEPGPRPSPSPAQGPSPAPSPPVKHESSKSWMAGLRSRPQATRSATSCRAGAGMDFYSLALTFFSQRIEQIII